MARVSNDIEVVDIHQHCIPEGYFDAVKGNSDALGASFDGEWFRLSSGSKIRWDPRHHELERRIADMDRARIDVAAISISPPLLAYGEPPQAAKRLCTIVNDALEDFARSRPDRFVVMGHVPLQDVDAAVAELESRRFRAVQIGSHVNGRNLDDPALLPFFKAAERLKTFIFVHPNVSGLIGADRLRSYHLQNLIGNVTETAVAIASVMFGGVLDACPGLGICFAHAGGTAPFIWGRWAHGQKVRREAKLRTSTPIAALRERIYFDTISHSASALRFLLGEVGTGRVLFGSDYPADMGDEDQVAAIRDVGLDGSATRSILGGNAARLLGLA